MIASMAESGGAEMLVRNLARDFARRGHVCHIVYISDAARLNASRDYEQAFKLQMDEAGITYTELGHACRRNVLLGGWRLRRAIRRFKPDIVHTHLGYGLLFQVAGLVGAPTVYTHHNIIFRFSPKLFAIFDRFVNRYVAICGACERLLAQHVGQPVVLIYNGVPADFSRAPARRRLGRDVKLLSVGDLTPQKDYPTLIAAAPRIVAAFAAQGRSVTFEIAGGGAERPALEQAIWARGLEDVVRLLGVRRDVPALMADADLIVLASLHEGLPISLIEAAMSALPAVATAVGGNDDIVLDGLTGVLIPPGSPDRLADAVIELLADADRYAGYSAAARDHGSKFTLERCADAHLALYADVLAKRAR